MESELASTPPARRGESFLSLRERLGEPGSALVREIDSPQFAQFGSAGTFGPLKHRWKMPKSALAQSPE